jgi:small subunit ribosomal protein S3
MQRAEVHVQLKPGVFGVRVKIMPPDAVFPDKLHIIENLPSEEETTEKEGEQEAKAEEAKPEEAKTEEAGAEEAGAEEAGAREVGEEGGAVE